MFFQRYDIDRDGRIKFSEFAEALMPYENSQACEMLERRNANPPGYTLSQRTKEMYKHLWMLMMQVEVNSREVNRRMTNSINVPIMQTRQYNPTEPTPEVKRN